MAHIDPLLQRSKDFAAAGAHEAASIVAKYPVFVITCLDPRTDPSAFLVQPGSRAGVSGIPLTQHPPRSELRVTGLAGRSPDDGTGP